MLERQNLQTPKGIRAEINNVYRGDETSVIHHLIENGQLNDQQNAAIRKLATRLVEQVRQERKSNTGIDSFLTEYALSSDEGIALMCLAEALLRVPDKATIDSLIKDKLTNPDWRSHRGQSDSFFVNATTWALMLTGKVFSIENAENLMSKAVKKLISRSSEPVVRMAVDQAMRIMSKQFVKGRTIKEALTRAKKKRSEGISFFL